MPQEIASVPARSPASGSPLDDPQGERFQALLRDPRMFIRQQDPFTAAIWCALLKPTSEVLASFRQRHAEQPPPSDEPGEERSPDDPLAIVAIGEALVANALLGSEKSLAQIADRIEGKTGLRKGDDDPDANRGMIQGTIREVIAAFAEAAANRRGDDAVSVTATRVDNREALPPK
jgi:hypothetical protein